MGEQRVALEHNAHVAAMRGQRHDAAVIKPDVTRGGIGKAGDHAQRGGFAAAGGAKQDNELTGVDLERDVGDGVRVAIGLADGVKHKLGGGHRATAVRRTKRSRISSNAPMPTICTTAIAATIGSM